jgi:oligoendopeptidase F
MSESSVPKRNDINEKDKWNLTKLYSTVSGWEKEYKNIEDTIKKYEQYKGKLASSADLFFDALEFDLNTSRVMEKLYTYSHLINDQDKTDTFGEELYQKSVILYSRLSEASSFILPEIQSVPDEKMNSFLEHKRAQGFEFFLHKILRYKNHTLSKDAEHVMAQVSEAFSAPSKIFSQLDNADFKFGSLENGKGETKELSHGNFNTFLMDTNRDVRKKAFFQYYDVYDNHRYALAASLSSSIKTDWTTSRVRNHASCRKAALFSDNVDESVYDNLINAVHDAIPGLDRHMLLRKKILGLDDIHFFDTYVPIVSDVDFTMEYEEAVETCVNSIAPLGESYQSTLKDGLLNGWVDRYENKGKRSGAYSSGCYDSDPYILLNYDKNNINSLYTLIHEAGHSMHSYYSAKEQSYVNHSYTIFVAEVASTFNEILLSKYLLQKYDDNVQMKKYIINRELENLRGTLYRQTMFAEFEHITHSLVEQDIPLTLELMRSEYRKLLDIYFKNSLIIDDVLELECFRIPHFYHSFYVYKYATGISAAVALAEGVSKNTPGSVGNYHKFLTLGGSAFPIDELKVAGVDMTQVEPVANALKRFVELLDEFEKL